MTNPAHHIYGVNASVAEVAAVCLKESFAELFRRWESAAEGSQEDPEHVHQLRVAARRANAVLRLFADHLPRRKTKKMLRRLDAIRKSAGPARDCDVFGALLAGRMSERAETEVAPRPPGENPLAELLQCQRVQARRELLHFYEKYERGEKLERAVTKLLGSLQPRGKRAVREATNFQQWAARQLRRATRDFFAESRANIRHYKQLHQLRIRAKQLRYRLEWLQPAFASDHYEKPYSSLKKLCQRLGVINDHVTAVALLSNWLETTIDGESITLLHRWLTEERRILKQERSNFDDWWSGRQRRRIRQRLAETVRSARMVRQPR